MFIRSSLRWKFKEESYRPKYTTSSFTLSEKKSLPNLQELSNFFSKTLLSSVYFTVTTCFDKCFLLYVITGRHSFLYVYSLQLPWGSFQPPCSSCLWNKCIKSPYFIFYLQNNSKVPNEPLSYRPNYYFLTTFIFWWYTFLYELFLKNSICFF